MYQALFTAIAKQVEPGMVAFVSMRGPYDQMPKGFERLYGWIGQHGLTPAGPPMGVYLTDPATVPASEAVWEIWAPINEAGELEVDANDLGTKRIPGVTVASTTYLGPYEAMEPTYRQLMGWIVDQGYVVAGPPEEVYMSDPSVTEPDEYVTEIRIPIEPRGAE